MKVIHQAVLAVIRTVNSRWLLRMGPWCRTTESANTNHRFKEVSGSYAVRSAWISYIPIQIRWLRVWTLEGDVENEDRITKINTRLQGLFGAQFEILIGKLHGNVMYFVVFCNLINILNQHFSRSPKRRQCCACKTAAFVACLSSSFRLMGAL